MNGAMRHGKHRRAGFTLIEMIATMTILAAIGSLASMILFNATDGYVSAATQGQIHTELSIVVDRIVREFRGIALDETAAGIAPDIESVSSDAITWNDDDALSLSGTVLLLQEDGGAAAVLATDVTDFTLRAFDESNAELALPLSGAGCDAIRRLSIALTVQRQGSQDTVRTRVFLRCTMSGAA